MNIIDHIRENIDELDINSYINGCPLLDEDLIREFKDKIDWTDVELLKSFDLHSKLLRDEFKKELRELREVEERRVKEKLEFTSEMIRSLLEDIH